MIISWFKRTLGDNDYVSKNICDTKGELPPIGCLIFLNESLVDGTRTVLKRTKYKVVDAYIKLNIDESLAVKHGKTIVEALEKFENDPDLCVAVSITDKTIKLSEQRGEVILEKL